MIAVLTWPQVAAISRSLTLDRGDVGTRLDKVLTRHLADIRSATRTRVQSWIQSGRVSLNGAPVRRAAARPALGDVVTVILPATAQRRTARGEMAAEAIDLDILYEDEHLMAVNKPAGVVMHPTYRYPRGTVMNALLWRARAWPDGQRPSLVQRLDRLTSGVVLVAKTRAVHAALQKALASRRGQKDYLAVVYGRVSPARGVIDLRLGRDSNDPRRVVVSETVGVASRTAFERLDGVAAPRAGLSLLRCRLLSGRMHQIRVHLSARGWFLVGDALYGKPRWSDIDDPNLAAALRAFPRQALHAWRLAVTHPMTRARLILEAPIPNDFRDLLEVSGLSAARAAVGSGTVMD